MKRWIWLVLAAVMLSGCARMETLETVADELETPALGEPRQIQVSLPDEAAAPVMESNGAMLYLCQDYEIVIQTLAGGDMDATILALTGYHKEELTVLETENQGVHRYDFVWAAAGEEGDQLGRGVVLDDGSYHYAMTVLRNVETQELSQIVWRTVFESFTLAPV